jgi:hypothetical protein
MSQANEQWDALCALTTELFPKFGARPEAFKEACRLRPDLAAAAIDPAGVPVDSKRRKSASRWNASGSAQHLRDAIESAGDNSADVLLAAVDERSKR